MREGVGGEGREKGWGEGGGRRGGGRGEEGGGRRGGGRGGGRGREKGVGGEGVGHISAIDTPSQRGVAYQHQVHLSYPHSRFGNQSKYKLH